MPCVPAGCGERMPALNDERRREVCLVRQYQTKPAQAARGDTCQGGVYRSPRLLLTRIVIGHKILSLTKTWLTVTVPRACAERTPILRLKSTSFPAARIPPGSSGR